MTIAYRVVLRDRDAREGRTDFPSHKVGRSFHGARGIVDRTDEGNVHVRSVGIIYGVAETSSRNMEGRAVMNLLYTLAVSLWPYIESD